MIVEDEKAQVLFVRLLKMSRADVQRQRDEVKGLEEGVERERAAMLKGFAELKEQLTRQVHRNIII